MHNANQPEKYERLKRQTDKALNKIRLYYQMGLTLLKQHPLNSELKQLYEPLNSDTQAKIRRFANPDKGGYTKKQLEELLKLCREHEKPFPLGFKLIERLLSIPIEQRKSLQKRMVEEGWSRRELDCQISLISTNRSWWKAGRPTKRLPTEDGVIPELWHMSKEWADRATSITVKYSDVLKELNEADRNRFTKATAMIQRLKLSLGAHLQKALTSNS